MLLFLLPPCLIIEKELNCRIYLLRLPVAWKQVVYQQRKRHLVYYIHTGVFTDLLTRTQCKSINQIVFRISDTCMCSCTHTRMHALTHTRTHTHARTHARTHTHTHTHCYLSRCSMLAALDFCAAFAGAARCPKS